MGVVDARSTEDGIPWSWQQKGSVQKLETGLSPSLHKDVRTHSPKPKSDFEVGRNP